MSNQAPIIAGLASACVRHEAISRDEAERIARAAGRLAGQSGHDVRQDFAESNVSYLDSESLQRELSRRLLAEIGRHPRALTASQVLEVLLAVVARVGADCGCTPQQAADHLRAVMHAGRGEVH